MARRIALAAAAALFAAFVATPSAASIEAAQSSAAPSVPGPWDNLYYSYTGFDVQEGKSVQCVGILTVEGKKGMKNCSNTDGWYATYVDETLGAVALVYPIEGEPVCYGGKSPSAVVKPYALWPDMDFVQESTFMGRTVNSFHLVGGRYYAPLMIYKDTNTPAVFGQGIMNNIHQLATDFAPNTVAVNDSRLDIPLTLCNITELTSRPMPDHELDPLSLVFSGDPVFDAVSRRPADEKLDEHRAAVRDYHASLADAYPSFTDVLDLKAVVAVGAVPAAADNSPYATSVRNQGRCGACWSFSTTALTEVVMNRAHNATSNRTASEWLAPQSKIDCVHGNMNGTALLSSKGCMGGWPLAALAHTVDHGIATEATYPFAFVTGSHCKLSNPGVAIVKPLASAFSLPANSVDLMRAAIAQHGAVVSIINAEMEWAFFSGNGVFDDPACVPGLAHAITLVGYGTDEATGKPYWLVKNSFGPGWSHAGYIRMVAGVNMCGIEDFAFGARAAQL